jgi:hypothetical protein
LTEAVTLLIILAAVYVSDCFLWVRNRTVLFASDWLRGWKPVVASEFAGSASGSLKLLNPIPPLGRYFQTYWPCLSLSPIGVCAYTLHSPLRSGRLSQSGEEIAFEQITDARNEGRKVYLNNSHFASCSSEREALGLVRLIDQLRTMPEIGREAHIRGYLNMRLAKDMALDRMASLTPHTDALGWTCNAYFLYLFVFVPLVAGHYGLIRSIVPAAAGILLGGIWIAVLYFRGHKKEFGDAPNDRFGNVVKMILCPPVSIRAVDLMTLDALTDFHPVLIARITLGERSRTFVRAFISDLTHPVRHELTNERAVEIVTWFQKCELECCSTFLRDQEGTDLNELLIAPDRSGSSLAYCPRCYEQYEVLSGECPDCTGVALVAFPAGEAREVMRG